jgi:hypothetical protein
MPTDGTLFLHFPCFDGLVSATLARDYLETQRGWRSTTFRFVNYDRQPAWLDSPLPPDSAVVDFLYHPDATFWADHHGTTFLTPEAGDDFAVHRSGRTLLYDRDSPSCAMLLWKHFGGVSSDPERYGEMAAWADLIDSARYASVEEAVFGESPAMRINASLALDATPEYGEHLLRLMNTMGLAETAASPEVERKAAEIRRRTELGLADVAAGVHRRHGSIAVFAGTPSDGAQINRYSLFHFFPDARYSVALLNGTDSAKVTAMRNPWLEFESIDLGSVFRAYGGGGHQRVASAVLPRRPGEDPAHVLAAIVDEIDRTDRHREKSKIPA